jgi:hypothetical protein
VKFIFLVLFFLGGLASTAKSEAVLPAYLLGLVVAGAFLRDKTLVQRTQSGKLLPPGSARFKRGEDRGDSMNTNGKAPPPPLAQSHGAGHRAGVAVQRLVAGAGHDRTLVLTARRLG